MSNFKYRETMTLVFVVILVISNLVGPKMCQVGPFKLSGAELLFPITYIFGDVFTEVYGYAASRRAIWMGFLAMGLLSVFGEIAVALPPAPDWHNQQAFATVFGLVPRFAIASLVAYWAGEFTNSYTMAKLKLLTKGTNLWPRHSASTVTEQAVDTTIGDVLAVGDGPCAERSIAIEASYIAKVLYEVLA